MDRAGTTPVIELHDLRRDFVRRAGRGLRRSKVTTTAVAGITLDVAEAEIVGWLGPNGAGKSTTIKMCTGILVPTGGTVRVCGLDPVAQRTTLARRIGVVFGQRSQLWWDLPLRDSFGSCTASTTPIRRPPPPPRRARRAARHRVDAGGARPPALARTAHARRDRRGAAPPARRSCSSTSRPSGSTSSPRTHCVRPFSCCGASTASRSCSPRTTSVTSAAFATASR